MIYHFVRLRLDHFDDKVNHFLCRLITNRMTPKIITHAVFDAFFINCKDEVVHAEKLPCWR